MLVCTFSFKNKIYILTLNHGCICYDIEFVTGTTGMPVKNSIGLGKMFG